MKGHSIQDIETWDDTDEAAAQTVFEAAKADKSLIGLAMTHSFSPGTTMAFYENAAGYDAITSALNDALE